MNILSDKAAMERWLRDNENQIVPAWIAELRRKAELGGSTATQELRHHVFLLYYDRVCHAMLSGQNEDLERMLRRLLADHLRQHCDIRQILQIPLLLRAVLWRMVFASFPARQAEQMVEQVDPVLDLSIEILVKGYAETTEVALNQQLEEMDFLAQRLALSSQEAENAVVQLNSLYNIARAITSTLDIHETLDGIAGNLEHLAEIERCTIWLVTSPTTLQVGVTKGPGDTPLANITLPLDKPASFVSRALLECKQQRLQDQGDVLAQFFPDRDALALPMVNDRRPVGVVMINGHAGDPPLALSTVNLIQAATEQAAVALENAQLYGQIMQFNQELEEKVRQRTAELQEANEELERVNRDLERLDKTKSDFISIAAHELKTPLTLIQGYTNIIRDDGTIKSNTFLSNVLQGIVKGSERLYSIIESMIDVSLIDSQVLQLRPTQASLGNLIRTLTEQYQKVLEERSIVLQLSDFNVLPYIEADPQRLYQVFDNLLINAIKYTPDGGQIVIESALLKGQEDDDWIEIVIKDSGIGINSDDLERIFDKFYQTGQVALHSSGRTKFKGGGPGLGLAIAKGIVEAHGGRIWAESEGYDENKYPGSQFHVVLPVKSRIRMSDITTPFSYARSSN